jgi:phage shock protein C
MKKHIKKVYRSRTDRVIAGVAGGLGDYFEIDPVIFRIIFVILIFAGGFAILFYLILIFVIPLEPERKIGKGK